QVGRGQIDPEARQRRRGIYFSIFFQVDPVVNDTNPRRVDIEQTLDVLLGLMGNGNDSVRHFQGGFLNPQAEIVTTTELFALPRPQWFQRVDCDEERNLVAYFRKNSAEVAVPRVAVDEVGIDIRRVK